MATRLQRLGPVEVVRDHATQQLIRKLGFNVGEHILLEGHVYENLLAYAEPPSMVNAFTNSGITPPGTGSTVVMMQPKPLAIELTTDMTNDAGTWTADCELLDDPGNEFTITDVFHEYHHAIEGDQGWLGYDQSFELLVPWKLNARLIRSGTLGGDLASGSSASATVTISGKEYTVYGHNVRSSYKIPSGGHVTFEYDYTYDKWVVISTNVCMVLA